MSVVTWFENIPTDWSIKRVKYVSPLQATRASVSSEAPHYIGLENVESWTGRFIETTSSTQIDDSDLDSHGTAVSFKAGDVLFGKLRPYLAKALLAQSDGVGSTEFLVLRPSDELDAHFFLYVLLSSNFVSLVDSSTFGAKMPRANWDFIGSVTVPVPSFDTQRRIAEYLDTETAQIDALIAEKEHMLALLAEKRAALVSRAVTRGLDLEAPMKPAGLEWLGEIPAHWKVKRAKWMFREIDIRSTTGEEILLSLRMTRGLVPHDEVSEKPIPSKDLIGYKLVQPDEIVINRMRAASGLIAISPQAGIVSPDYAVFHTLASVLPDYYTILFKTPLLQSLFRSYSTGLGTGSSGFLRLYSDDFLALWFPAPPFAEQQAIVDFLTQDQAKTAHMEAELILSISLLKERRSALITAAVTGQLGQEVMAT